MAGIITKGQIAYEDLSIGTSTFARATSTGGTQTLHQIPLPSQSIPLVDISTAQVLTNKTLTTGIIDPSLEFIERSAPSGIGGADLLWADATAHRLKMNNNNASADPIVGAATTDTLTNKTLTAPVITNPTTTGTDAGVETLNSKTLGSPVINGTPTGTGIPTITLKKGSGAGDYPTSSTSYVDVDATNLAYGPVTIPTGWKLAITAAFDCFNSTGASNIFVALFDGSTINERKVNPPNATSSFSSSLAWVINGDGASHTVKLQFKTDNAADAANIRNSTATIVPTMLFILSPSN